MDDKTWVGGIVNKQTLLRATKEVAESHHHPCLEGQLHTKEVLWGQCIKKSIMLIEIQDFVELSLLHLDTC